MHIHTAHNPRPLFCDSLSSTGAISAASVTARVRLLAVRASLAFTSTTLNPQCRAITCASVVLPVPVCVVTGGRGGSNSQEGAVETQEH
jgi:hypothetical protein